MQVAVRELKNQLSELLKRAEAGEEIVVTSHGRPGGGWGPSIRSKPPILRKPCDACPGCAPATVSRFVLQGSRCLPCQLVNLC